MPKITKQEKRWFTGILMSLLAYGLLSSPINDFIENIFPSSGLRIGLGIIIIVGVIYLFNIR